MPIRFPTLVLAALVWLGVVGSAHGHLMVAQRGTLKIDDDGAFVLLSVPVGAFEGVDDDGDGSLGAGELAAHRRAIERQVHAGLRLVDDHGPRPLEGLLVNLSSSTEDHLGAGDQLVVMGRFALASSSTSTLRLQIDLFGDRDRDRDGDGARDRDRDRDGVDARDAQGTIEVTARRGSQTRALLFTADRTDRPVFPSDPEVFAEFAELGAWHILAGFDHLLFLMVVVATGWRPRHVVLALTCFTLGHAVTLAACAWGGLMVPASLVEPAIAATIVAMAAWELRSPRHRRQAPSTAHFAAVFGCALIHGLGLATALDELGLAGADRLYGLAGFNVGIELGQVAIACAVGLGLAWLGRRRGPATREVVLGAILWTSVAMGSLWLIQRVVG